MACACDCRDASVASSVPTTDPLKLPLTTFCSVGMTCVPVMAASHVGFSAFQSVTIAPVVDSEYQTGFDSSSEPACS
ncbi:MAG: hypothetical protein NVSMB68_00780 [Thermoanaerobaculia bacterium]